MTVPSHFSECWEEEDAFRVVRLWHMKFNQTSSVPTIDGNSLFLDLKLHAIFTAKIPAIIAKYPCKNLANAYINSDLTNKNIKVYIRVCKNILYDT